MRLTLIALLLLVFSGCDSGQTQVEVTQPSIDNGEGENPQEGDQSHTDNTSPNQNNATTEGSVTSEATALFNSAADQVELLGQQYNLQAPVSPGEWRAPSFDTLPVYNYPADFPLTQQGEILHSALRVIGLSPRTVYRFSTASQPTSQGSQGLFVFNTSPDGQIASPVCMDSVDCSGTAITGTVLIVVVTASADTALHSFDIDPTGEPPVYDEGTSTNPVLLNGSLPITHNGAVGPIRVADQALVAGESHYRVNGLIAGNRYRLAMLNRANMDALLELTKPVDLQCDPNFSTASDCRFVAADQQIQFSVLGTQAIFGDSFNLEISLLADADQFDGSWHSPLALNAEPDNTVRHLAKVDHGAGSYYRIDNLSPALAYQVFATGKSNGASLSLFNSASGQAIYSPGCESLIDSFRSSTDEVCVIAGSESIHLWVKGLALDTSLSEYGPAGGTRLLLSIAPGVGEDGTTTDPIEHLADPASVTRFEAHVREQSIYRLTGLEPGKQMMVSIAEAGINVTVLPVDSSGNTLSCDDAGSRYCVFTPAQSSALIAVTAEAGATGESLWLTVSPQPSNETLLLNTADLPYQGQTGNFFSNYTISGLEPDRYYLAEVSSQSISTKLSAWPASSNTISCMTEDDEGPSLGCLVADSGGQIKLRVSARRNGPGAIYNVDVLPALPLLADYTSTDTPIDIFDNDATGRRSSIVVQDHPVEAIDAITITVLLDHGYSKDLLLTLIAPDGRRFVLADHLGGSLNVHTQFSDLAARSSSNVEAYRYRRVFRPHQPLHLLHGISANGIWQLQVADDRYSNISSSLGGKLVGWGLSFAAPVDTGFRR